MSLSYFEQTLIRRELENECIKAGIKDVGSIDDPKFEHIVKTVGIDAKTGKASGAKEVVSHIKHLEASAFGVGWGNLSAENFEKKKDELLGAVRRDTTTGVLPKVDSAELSPDEFKDVEAMLRSSGQTRYYSESVERIAKRQQKESQEND
jgi:hypothetical protein